MDGVKRVLTIFGAGIVRRGIHDSVACRDIGIFSPMPDCIGRKERDHARRNCISKPRIEQHLPRSRRRCRIFRSCAARRSWRNTRRPTTRWAGLLRARRRSGTRSCRSLERMRRHPAASGRRRMGRLSASAGKHPGGGAPGRPAAGTARRDGGGRLRACRRRDGPAGAGAAWAGCSAGRHPRLPRQCAPATGRGRHGACDLQDVSPRRSAGTGSAGGGVACAHGAGRSQAEAAIVKPELLYNIAFHIRAAAR